MVLTIPQSEKTFSKETRNQEVKEVALLIMGVTWTQISFLTLNFSAFFPGSAVYITVGELRESTRINCYHTQLFGNYNLVPSCHFLLILNFLSLISNVIF